ncbi:MAG TPA: hypothetical protein VGD56_18185, partial [Gemmatirosa sp.]
VTVRDRDVDLHYEVEERADGPPLGVVRLRLPEKLARTLVDDELPDLDRPMRFLVLRGPRGAVRADTLDELQDVLDRPWSPDEERRAAEREAADRNARRDEQRERALANELYRHSNGPPSGRSRGGGRGAGPGGRFGRGGRRR